MAFGAASVQVHPMVGEHLQVIGAQYHPSEVDTESLRSAMIFLSGARLGSYQANHCTSLTWAVQIRFMYFDEAPLGTEVQNWESKAFGVACRQHNEAADYPGHPVVGSMLRLVGIQAIPPLEGSSCATLLYLTGWTRNASATWVGMVRYSYRYDHENAKVVQSLFHNAHLAANRASLREHMATPPPNPEVTNDDSSDRQTVDTVDGPAEEV